MSHPLTSAYDLLAAHYDAATGDSRTEAAFVGTAIRNANSRAVTLLEVACGTGSIVAHLANSYHVSGLDISPGMLAVAREKLPAGTALYLADMSGFQLDLKFDVIVCVYHGINHLLSFAAWKAFFACARRHLNDDGVLIFDILTIDDLKMMTHVPKTTQQFDGNYLLITVRTTDDQVFEWNIEVLEVQPTGEYHSVKEIIRTASFPVDQICQALSEFFANVRLIESDGNSIHEDGGNRIWFLCTEPVSAPLAPRDP